MKNILIIIAALSLPFITQAQVTNSETTTETNYEKEKSDEIEYLSTSDGTHGIYFGIGSSLARLDKNDFVFVDTRFAYVADQKFEFGFGGSFFHNLENLNTARDSSTYIAGGLGGFHFKAIFNGNKKFHLSIPLYFGGGSASVYSDDDHFVFDEVDLDEESWAPFLFVEPGVNLELNINRIVGFEVGVKYMMTTNSNTNIDYYENLSGFKIQAMLKIGIFGLGSKKGKVNKNDTPISNGDYLEF